MKYPGRLVPALQLASLETNPLLSMFTPPWVDSLLQMLLSYTLMTRKRAECSTWRYAV